MYLGIKITYLHYSSTLYIHVDSHQEDIHPWYDYMVDWHNYMFRDNSFQIFLIHTLQIKKQLPFWII
jgi:hypothetical protein